MVLIVRQIQISRGISFHLRLCLQGIFRYISYHIQAYLSIDILTIPLPYCMSLKRTAPLNGYVKRGCSGFSAHLTYSLNERGQERRYIFEVPCAKAWLEQSENSPEFYACISKIRIKRPLIKVVLQTEDSLVRTELLVHLRFDLTDTLSSDAELSTYLFECVLNAV